MLNIRHFHMIRRFATGLAVFLAMASLTLVAQAQTYSDETSVDPRLIEIVEQVKSRTLSVAADKLRVGQPETDASRNAKQSIQAVNEIRKSIYSRNPEKIRTQIESFEKKFYERNDNFPLTSIIELYSEYANLLEAQATAEQHQAAVEKYTQTGSWFERYIALSHLSQLHGSDRENQAALQKAQSALALIPQDDDSNLFVIAAKENITAAIAQLHNYQGNTDLAILTSLEYLKLTKDNPNTNNDIDLINNLIFSHNMSRDHAALVYLSEQLLEIEKSGTSSIVGLSEYRIAQVMNSLGDFESGLSYARTARSKSDHPLIQGQAHVNEAIALTGLGRIAEARLVAADAEINLNPTHLLTEETSRDRLYLAFLLAQSEDTQLATQLYSRQLDVVSQKFLDNNSRDTTAMLADLENSRERQAEREAATAREAELQAMTIDRQRKLNRLLMALVIFMALAMAAAILFARYRSKMVKELEIKTLQAASAEKLKTEFLGMISHELRTPLNAIIGISDYLANYHADADIREKTSIILKGGNDLLSVVESLTDMARIDAEQMDLNPVDTNVAEDLVTIPLQWEHEAKAKGLTFTYFIDPAITRHNVDKTRLIQCIDVLMSNAVGFTDTGRVHLHVTAKTNAVGAVSGLTAIVADTGRGMTELVQSRLFTPFMQADTSRKRNHMGTGLSLAIASALADMMGGDLTVVSREGRGSEFRLSVALKPVMDVVIDTPVTTKTAVPTQTAVIKAAAIKASKPEIKETLQPPIEAPFSNAATLKGPLVATSPVVDLMQPRASGPALHDSSTRDLKGTHLETSNAPTLPDGCYRILVVDDMAPNRDILRLMMEIKGHICVEAPGGLEALELLAHDTFDLAIMDVHMAPLDGIETLQRLRNLDVANADIPVIALTADNAPSTNAACMDAGADLFLTKPVRQAELLQALEYLRETNGLRVLRQRA